MKRMKKIITILLAACVMTSFLPQSVPAASAKLTFTASTSGSGSEIAVKSVKYDGEVNDGQYGFDNNNPVYELEIDFLTHVQWKQTSKISSVKDNKGKTYRAFLTDRDNDECNIFISNLKGGRTYTITIDGIKQYGASAYANLILKIKIPSAAKTSQKVKVAKVTINEDDDMPEIEIKFASKVSWKKNAKVTSIKDNKGSTYKGYLINRDNDECEIFIQNMKYNRTYKIKISGIRASGSRSYETITVSAKVPARADDLSIKKAEYEEDFDDGRMEYTVSFDFNKKIRHKADSYVLITDAAGNACTSASSYIEWDDDDCEVHLSHGLTRGSAYQYKIVNVKSTGSDRYITLNGYFIA